MIAPEPWWMTEALRLENAHWATQETPPLSGRVAADFCIVGGGYTGLWTALEIKQRAPDADVVVLESDICGAGASGRNGGFASSWWNRLDGLTARFGAERGREVALAISESLDAIERFCAENRVDAHFRRAGEVWATASEDDVGRWSAAVEACRRVGEGERLVLLSRDDCTSRTGSPALLGGVWMRDAAAVQPALLVRGLRRVALQRGVRIFERSHVALHAERNGVVETREGSVACGRLILATGAWSARIRALRLRLLPVASHILMTEPAVQRMTAERARGELLADAAALVHYTQVTVDGRVAFGRGGGPLGHFGRVGDRVIFDRRTAAAVRRDFATFFPALAHLAIESEWGGAVDRTPTHYPFFDALDDAGKVIVGAGYSGSGVVPAHLGGRILASLALDERDRWSRLPLVGLPDRLFPPEPLRTLGGEAVRRAAERSESLSLHGRRANPLTRAIARLVYFSLPRPGARLTRTSAARNKKGDG